MSTLPFTIPFRIVTPASASRTQSSRQLPVPYRIIEILVLFPINANHLLTYSFWEMNGPVKAATDPPAGRNIFQDYHDTGKISGEDAAFSLPLDYRSFEAKSHLTFFAENGVAAQLVAEALVTCVRTAT